MAYDTPTGNYTRGFTLIEMLTVIAIISILASVVVASFTPARTTARINTAVGMMESSRASGVVCVSRRSNLNTPTNVPAGVGGNVVCANTDLKWPTLPSGWSYQGAPACNADTFVADVSGGTFRFCAAGDGAKIVCTQTSCIKT